MIKQNKLDKEEFQMLSGTDLGVAMLHNKYMVTHPEVLDAIEQKAIGLWHFKSLHQGHSGWIVYFQDRDDAERIIMNFTENAQSNVTPIIEKIKPSLK